MVEASAWIDKAWPILTKRIELSELNKKRIRTRLVVAIPLLIVVLVLGGELLIMRAVNASPASPLSDWKRVLIVSVGSSYLLGLILALAITHPIKRLTVGAQTVAAGDLSKTVKIKSEDEIGTLGNAFDKMVISLNEQIIQSMTGGVITINTKGNVTIFNTAAELILGYDAKEVVGQYFSEVFPGTPENEGFVSIIETAIRKGRTYSSQETQITARDGRKVPIGITTSLLKDKNDTLLGVVATFKDLAQIKYLEEQMRRADRLAALGSLAAGVAHEIRNPLGSVKGLAQLLREDLPEADSKRSYLDVIIKEVDRLNEVVESLLSFSRTKETDGEAPLVPTDINKVMEEALILAEHDMAKDKVQIIREFDKSIPQIKGDGKKLQQAFLNIIFNAFQAMPNGGRLIIATRRNNDADWIKVIFSDTGKGIPQEHIDRLFDPFFTTKKEGTGLGLTITHQIVSRHHGRIDVESRQNEGTTFTVSLPCKEEKT